MQLRPLVAFAVVLVCGCRRQVPEPAGASTNTPSPTREGDPDKPMASTVAGFRIGEPIDEAIRACRASGHLVTDERTDAGAHYRDVRCEGVPTPEPGIDGDSVTLGVCGTEVCEVSVYEHDHPAASYRKALATLTATYGKPNELVSTPPSDENAARRGCSGASSLANASWTWEKPARVDVELSCVDGNPWVWVSLLDDRAVLHYRNAAADD